MSKPDQNAQAPEVEILDDDVVIDENFEQAANEEEQAEPSHGYDGIPDYRTTDEKTRALMDEYIDGINIYDVESVINLGQEELQKLADVAVEVSERIDADAELADTFENMAEQLGEIDVSGLTSKVAGYGAKGARWMFKNPMTAAATAGTALLAGPAALGIPLLKNQHDKMKAKRDGTDLADRLRKTVQSQDEVIGSLHDIKEKIPRAINELNGLGKARLEAYHSLSIIIGAGLEKLKRVDESELPKVQDAFEANPTDGEIEMQYQELQSGRELLENHVTDMMSSRIVSQAAVVSLARLKGVLKNAYGRANRHLIVSVPQWQAQRAEAGVLLIGQKVSRSLDEADNAGNNMLKQGQELGNHVSRMIEESQKKGSYDPQQVVAVLQDMSESIGAEVKRLGSDRKQLADARQKLSKESEKFASKIAGFQEAAKGRIALPNPGRADTAAAIEGPNPANDIEPS